MNAPDTSTALIELDPGQPVWERFFWVAPLVLVGTREADGRHDLAPKHMAMPMGWENYFGFVCSPSHHTYTNIHRDGAFTVSYPRPSQLVMTSLAASPRCEGDTKPALSALPVIPARHVGGVLVDGCSAYLECRLERLIDGFGPNSLIVGKVLAASVAEDALRVAERDDNEVLNASPVLSYLNPGRFAAVSSSYSFPFPAGMKK